MPNGQFVMAMTLMPRVESRNQCRRLVIWSVATCRRFPFFWRSLFPRLANYPRQKRLCRERKLWLVTALHISHDTPLATISGIRLSWLLRFMRMLLSERGSWQLNQNSHSGGWSHARSTVVTPLAVLSGH
ncbi:MAG: hypothetical protein KDB05_25990, partial [Planctomycetales bacterium]|nr:hypothetical protein [Planctomycetales bacterium]